VTAVGLERRLANFRFGATGRNDTRPAWTARASSVNAERLAGAVDGELVRTARGSYVRLEAPSTILPLDRDRLAGLPGQPPPDRPLVCLDTETTGLATAAGTLAFLVGLGWWEGNRFRQVQLLLPDHVDEPALLDELAARIPRDAWLVTYNGRGFDWPLLVARYRLARSSPPVMAGHLDLLPLVRRLFKHRMPDARLRSAETVLLGVDRGSDLPGWEIPGRFLEFLRGGEPGPLVDVVRHNDEDVRSLGRLLVHVDRSYADQERWPDAPAGDLAGLARAFARTGRVAEALRCLDTAIDSGSATGGEAASRRPPPAAASPFGAPHARVGERRTVDPDDDGAWWSPRRRPDYGGRPGAYAGSVTWSGATGERLDSAWTPVRLQVERARLLRRLGRHRDAEAAWLEIADAGGSAAILAWIEVAKLREHRLGDPAGALEATERAAVLTERRRRLGMGDPVVAIAVAERLARLRARLAAIQPEASRGGTSGTRGSAGASAHDARTQSRSGSNEQAIVRRSPASAFR